MADSFIQKDIVDMLRSGSTEDMSKISAQLDNISSDLRNMTKAMQGNMSQANYRNFYGPNTGYGYQGPGYGYSSMGRTFNQAYQNGWGSAKGTYTRSGTTLRGFTDNFEDALVRGLTESKFDKEIADALTDFARQINVPFKQLPDMFGKELGRMAATAFKNTAAGKKFTLAMDTFKSGSADIIRNRGSEFAKYVKMGGSLSDAAGVAGAGAVSDIVGLISKVGPALAEAVPALVLFALVLKGVDTAMESLKLTVEAVKKVYTALGKVANREATSRQENVKLAEKRMKDDFDTLVRQPFKILEEAANQIYNSWKTNLTTVSATQGYTKADVQDLMAAFAERLRQEGLSKYVSGADLFDNLAKVLNSGMSGQIAEEFAYQATVLGKAIPTQDFFNYASTYASIAANAVRSGQSQSQAIQAANESLSTFANGLLYASRELTGGFTTGLTNASEIYAESAKIAQAARSDNMSNISSVLLAVQGYVGAVAPDLASQLTSKIYSILTGGNSSDIVALRSLAGVNASNTEFLKQFAKNPQKIFASLFDNLAKMYSDSSDAYMEKAEGYAQLFGLSSEAFQRVDFAELSTAIRNMNMSSASLDQNMSLLVDGQTTTTAEQLKAQQINQYMIEEGLAYVIDNEAAQLIQQHMWDEQMKREMMESVYGVELQGSAMEALEMIEHAVNNILNFLNPVSWLKKIGNVVSTVNETKALDADLRQMLELGKVGPGNATALYQLTTRNADLHVARSLVEMMGGYSFYGRAAAQTKNWNNFTSPFYGIMDGVKSIHQINKVNDMVANSILASASSGQGFGQGSRYSWGSVSKSAGGAAAAMLGALSGTKLQSNLANVITSSGTSAASSSAAAAKSVLSSMLADKYLVDKFVKEGKTYEDWAASAAKFGIADMNAALQSAGYNESDIRQYFQDKETEQGVQEAHNIAMEEKLFRDTGIQFWSVDFPENFQAPLFTYMETLITNQEDWKQFYKEEWLDKGWPAYVSLAGNGGLFNKFYTEFMNYFIHHAYYDATSGYSYSDVESIQRAAKAQERGDTVYALAEMLTKNLLDLKDPTMQTNALLAQILVVVNAIMNQTNDANTPTSASSLMETLSGLSLGLTTDSSVGGSSTIR